MSAPDRVAARLADSIDSRTLVRLHRSPRNADRLGGFVLAVGSTWVLLSDIDRGYFDGITAVRLNDITKVARDKSFEGRFAVSQPDWPPTPPPGIDLDSTKGLIRSLGNTAPLIGIEQEGRYKSPMTWIGVATEIAAGWLWLHEVRPDASWKDEPLGYRLRQISKVRVSDRYQVALATIAGTPPIVDHSARP